MTRPGRDESGAVTAELAMVLPLLLAVTAGLVWLLAVGLVQVRATDAAREAARALARGEDRTAAVALATRVAPPGSVVEVSTDGEQVRVTVHSTVEGPGGLWSVLPGADLTATAVAAAEPGS